MSKFRVKLSGVSDGVYSITNKQVSLYEVSALLQSTEIDFGIEIIKNEDAKNFSDYVLFPYLVFVNTDTDHYVQLSFTDSVPKKCIPPTDVEVNLNELLIEDRFGPIQLLENTVGTILGPLVQVTAQFNAFNQMEIELKIAEEYQTEIIFPEDEIANFFVLDSVL